MTAAPWHRSRHSVLARYGFATCAFGAALLLEIVLDRHAGPHYRFMAFAPAVAFSAWFGGFGPAAMMVGASILATIYFHLGFDTAWLDGGDVSAIATFAACWLVVSLLAGRVYLRLRREGEFRLQAEGMARQADRLEQFTAAIAAARTTQAAIEATVQEVLFALQADAGALLVVAEDQREAHVARAVGYSADVSQLGDAVSLEAPGPLSDTVSRRSSLVFESVAELRREFGQDAVEAYRPRQSGAILPLMAGGRVIALLRLDFDAVNAFSADDRQFLTAIAPRAAQTLDRTAQYEAAQRARAEAERERARADEELAERQRAENALRASETKYRSLAARTTRLHELSTALSDAASLDAVARALVHHAKIVAGATAAAVTLLRDNGSRLETVCAEDHDGRVVGPQEPIGVQPGLCATAAIESRKPVFIRSFEQWQKMYWLSAARAADGGYASSASLPLIVEGKPIGVVEFHFTVPVNFDEDYCELLISVAQHCAQAIDRARLYESAQRDRADAQRANRLKDEFLSVVSHELRTPLNSIAGWASMLQKGQLDESLTTRALQAIRDNAGRQAQLIDELLDFSRIVAGRATLDFHDVELSNVLRGVTDSVLSLAATKGVTLEVEEIPRAVVSGDARRLEQVFFNLLGNALKFTPAGGSVRVTAGVESDHVRVAVADTGMGIDPQFLPHVFDRFRQADTAISRNFGGLGLGLSIAKQLAEAHGGAIAATSPGVGGGAVFTVTLPLAPTPAPPASGAPSVRRMPTNHALAG